MAIRYAVATGDWSDVETWDGGVSLPTIDDDVYLNGYTISSSDSTFMYASIRNTAETSLEIVDGGKLELTSNNTYNFICDLYQGNTSTLISCVADHINIRYYNFIGNSYLGNTFNPLFLTNNFVNGQKHYINYIGNIYGNILSTNRFFIYGGSGIPVFNAELTGNFYAGGAELIRIYSNSSNSSETFNLVGNAYASDYSYCFYLYAGAGVKIDAVNGNLYPSEIFPVLYNTGKIRFTDSILYANNTQNAIHFSSYFQLEIIGNFVWQIPSAGGSIIAISNNPDDMYPLESDTRSGVVYAGGTKIGTCIVPSPESVVKNVPVDNTVGTWAFDDELILRLSHCATVESTGSQIAGFNCGCE